MYPKFIHHIKAMVFLRMDEWSLYREKEKLPTSSVNTTNVLESGQYPQALYLSRFSRGGPIKFERTFFQIAKLRFSTILVDFCQNYQIFKKLSGDEFKSQGAKILESSPSYEQNLQNPFKMLTQGGRMIAPPPLFHIKKAF